MSVGLSCCRLKFWLSIPVHLRLFAAILLAFTLLGGCSRHATPSAASDQVLRYPIIQEPSTLDPVRIPDIYTAELLQNLYEGLVALDANSRPFPQLASKWEISPDGKTYTFHIRTEAKFHKPFARPVTAEDVKYSLERALNPDSKSPTAANYLGGILGAAEVAAGKTKSLAGLKVIDKQTISVTVTKPMGYFLGAFAYPTANVVCKEAIEKNGGKLDEKAAIGTGPFVLAEYRRGNKLIFEANPDYYLGKPKLSRIERPIVLDPETAHLMYENGEVDAILPALTSFANDQTNPKLKAESVLIRQANVLYLAFQERVQPVFKDKRVRQAFARSIDREELSRIAYKGTSPSAYSFIPPGVAGENPSMRVNSYDPDAARKLLADAGFAGGKGFPQVSLHILEHEPQWAALGQVIRDQVRAGLGITITLQEHEAATFWDESGHLERYPMFLSGWVADYPDAQDFLSTLLRTGAKINHLSYSNPEFDALCDRADAEVDTAKRVPLYQRADQIAMEDAGLIPLIAFRQPMLVKTYVKDSHYNLLIFFLPHLKTRIQR